MSIATAASNLDLNGWLRGLFSAGISGGASAVVGGFTVSGMDPKDYNFAQSKFYILVGALFVTNAVVSVAKFLAAQPLPGVKEMTAMRQVVQQDGQATKIIDTTKEVHTEPIVKP
jgi:hypothetical protein